MAQVRRSTRQENRSCTVGREYTGLGVALQLGQRGKRAKHSRRQRRHVERVATEVPEESSEERHMPSKGSEREVVTHVSVGALDH